MEAATPPRSPEDEPLSRSARVLVALARFCYRHPWLVLAVSVALFVASIFYTVNNLQFDPSRSNLIRRDPELQRNLDRYLAEFPEAEDLVVVVEGGTKEDRKAFVDDLARDLRREPNLFREVFEKVDLPFLRTHALHYLDPDTLKTLSGELKESLPLLDSLSSSSNMVGLLESFGGSAGGDPAATMARILPFLNEAMEQLRVSLETRGRFEYRSPWAKAFFGDAASSSEAPAELADAGETTFYNSIAKGELYLLLARPAHSEDPNQSNTEAAVARMRQLITQVQRAHPQVRVGLTGEPVLDTDEMLSSARDSQKSAIQSLILVSIAFALAFRELGRPLMAVFSLVLGIGWTIGFTTLAIGHLNLLTVTFATILVGLGIDFGIHSIYRYDEEREKGLEPLPAMERTLAGTGVENLTGAMSTAFAFWVLNLTDFVGIAELGTIAGTGIMLCYLAMVTTLPSLLFLQERFFPGGHHHTGRYPTLARLEERSLAHPWVVAGLCLAFSVWCALQAPKVRYDYNLLNLQAKELESVQTEMHMIRSSDRSLLFGISLAPTVEEARRLTAAYEKLPTVSMVESIIPMVPEDYQDKRPALAAVEKQMARVGEPSKEEKATGGMARNLQAMADGFLELDRTFREAYPRLVASPDEDVRRQAVRFKTNLERLFSTLESMGPGPIEDGLTAFQRSFFADLQGLIGFLKDQVAGPPITLQDVPRNLRVREIGRHGAVQIRIYPKANIWERGPMEHFVHSLQSVDPQVVGMPVMMYYDTQELRTANEDAGWYALVAIVLILLVHFRSLKTTLLALFPKAVGVLWMVGLMGWFGVDFNSANFLALPLILGIGLVFGVHVVHRVQEEGGEGMFAHSTGPANALAALSTMLGFGTMIAATHQGISSLGFVMTVGVGANLVSSIVFLPAVLRILRGYGVTVEGKH